MNAQIERIVVKSGPELESTAKKIATERGLRRVTDRGYRGGLAPVGPSIGLYDKNGNRVAEVVYDRL